jgi:hypothetical protein
MKLEKVTPSIHFVQFSMVITTIETTAITTFEVELEYPNLDYNCM